MSTPAHILITGASGFLGGVLTRYFARDGSKVTALHHSSGTVPMDNVHWCAFDFAHTSVQRLLDTTAPSLLINCAAIASRDACERQPRLARTLNAELPAQLAHYCAERRIRFVHISTDLVFDGCVAPYSETDTPNPLSLYAMTKLEAEHGVAAANPQAYILRTALMYGSNAFGDPASFLAWTLDALRRRQELLLYTNQFRTPLYAPDVARAIKALLAIPAPGGVYHLAGPERLSRHDIGLRIADFWQLPIDTIQPTTIPRPAPLTATDDTSLNTQRIRTLTGLAFLPFLEAIKRVRATHGSPS